MEDQLIYECVYNKETETYRVWANGSTIGQFKKMESGFYRSVVVWTDLMPACTVPGAFAQIVAAYEDHLKEFIKTL